MPKRPSQLEMQQRLDMVSALLSRGVTTSQMIQGLMNHFAFGQRQAYRYLEKVKAQLLTVCSDPNALRSMNALRREHLYVKALEEKNYELANKIIDSSEKALLQKGGQVHDTTQALAQDELDSLFAKFTTYL